MAKRHSETYQWLYVSSSSSVTQTWPPHMSHKRHQYPPRIYFDQPIKSFSLISCSLLKMNRSFKIILDIQIIKIGNVGKSWNKCIAFFISIKINHKGTTTTINGDDIYMVCNIIIIAWLSIWYSKQSTRLAKIFFKASVKRFTWLKFEYV